MGTQLKVSPEIIGPIRDKAIAEGVSTRIDLDHMGAADGDVWNLRGWGANDVEVLNLTIFATEMLPGILVSGRLRIHPDYQGRGWGKLLAQWRDAVAEANGLRVMAMARTKNSKQRLRLERQGFHTHAWIGGFENGHRLMLKRRLDDID